MHIRQAPLGALALFTLAACGGLGQPAPQVVTVTVKTLELAGDSCALAPGSILQRFYVVNESRIVRGARLWPDSDQDGVSDRDEASNGTDPTRPRRSAGGCSDRIMQLLGSAAPTCTAACSAAPAATDSDGDTLLDCEELALGTNPNAMDSDGDGLLDAVETRFGTDPKNADTRSLDADQDGVSDGDEIFAGTDPFSAEAPEGAGYTYAAPVLSAGGCFHYDVANVDVLPTLSGGNQICTYVVDSVHAQRACVSIQYTP